MIELFRNVQNYNVNEFYSAAWHAHKTNTCFPFFPAACEIFKHVISMKNDDLINYHCPTRQTQKQSYNILCAGYCLLIVVQKNVFQEAHNIITKENFSISHLHNFLFMFRKAQQVYFIYPFPCWLKLGKALKTCCVNFFRLSWHFFLAKQELIMQVSLHVHDFATGNNFSCNLQCHNKQSAFFLSKVNLQKQ